jgi:hypothetical protein
MDIVRYGRFSVIDRGVTDLWRREQAADRPRYAVIEHDAAGPILRAGPFRVLGNAIEQCQQLAFRAELKEDHHGAET